MEEAYPLDTAGVLGWAWGQTSHWGAGLGADMVAGLADGLSGSHSSQAGLMESQQEKWERQQAWFKENG